MVLDIPGYSVTELIHKGDDSLIYRGVRQADGRTVVLKTLAAQYPTLSAIANLKHEFNVLSTIDIPCVVKAVDWKNLVPAPVLVVQDFQGLSLQQYLEQEGALSIALFVPIALKITRALSQLHQNNLIYQNIQPNNILIDPTTREINLIDFKLASQLTQDPSSTSIHRFSGTYAYMSPEQTGRMNRTIDHRSDLYSLGITFYQMLTEKLPFQAQDPMEWVHCHIAKSYPRLKEVNPLIPDAISQIISKLLSKMAEDRYQQAQGLIHDLETCLEQLESSGNCHPFPIGTCDTIGCFQLPQVLYGREEEISNLLEIFENAGQGSVELALVSGYSGVGKSTLVNEINRPIVGQRGYFVAGKFEQIRRDIPYEFLVRPFQDLIRQILSEGEAEIRVWKQRLAQGLGSNGQVLIEIIPELEVILGTLPPPPEVTPAESKARLNQTFQRMVHLFAQPEHPLVIFLDDLQWVDSASLELIMELLIDAEGSHLMIIGAYRDNEVTLEHPLQLLLEKLHQRQFTVHEIALQPLQLTHVHELTSDLLTTTIDNVQSLSTLIFEKTLGNAFFTRMLLQALYRDKKLIFDFDTSTWQWDVDELRAMSLTDNVVELMTDRMHQLSDKTQNALSLAACLGNQFNLNILSIVLEQSPTRSAEILWPALNAGLIIPIGDSYRIPMVMDSESLSSELLEKVCYKFGHDKIQEAAYALLSTSNRIQLHWQIGQLLLQQTHDLSDVIFDIVHHLNRGKTLAIDEAEQFHLANLNWQAGLKAKMANAYMSALKYYHVGLSLLSETIWQDNYELAFPLYRDASECEYLCGNFEQAEQLFEQTQSQAKSIYDQTSVDIIRIVLYDNQGKYTENLTVGGEALTRLGLQWPKTSDETTTRLQEELARYQSYLTEHNIELARLVDQPEMKDPTALAAMQLLVNMTGPAYFTDPTLATLVTVKMALLSIEYGNSKWTSQGYTFWGAMLSSAFRDYSTAYEFGQVALRLKEKYNNYNEVKVLNSYAGFISPWRRHFSVGVKLLRHAYSVAVEVGDVFAGYVVAHLGLHLIMMGTSLSTVETELSLYVAYLRKSQNEVFRRHLQVYLYCIHGYQSGTLESQKEILADFNEAVCLNLFQENQYLPGLVCFSTLKITHYFLLEDYETALQCCHVSEPQLPFSAGVPGEVVFVFYHALVLASIYNSSPSEERSNYLEKLHEHSEKLRIWSENCAENYLHQHLLILAEIARISEENYSSYDLYERSIAVAQEYGFIQDLAIANELAGRFALSQNDNTLARHYLKSACYAYQQWGAIAKVSSLENRYRHLLVSQTPLPVATKPLNETQISEGLLSSILPDVGNPLDLSTVVKSSQAIASQIHLDDLLQTLMQIMIENAGAQSGALISKEAGKWQVDAIAYANGDVVICDSQQTQIEQVLPRSVMNYVFRTQESIIIDGEHIPEAFQYDAYMVERQPKSSLCMPIIHQSQIKGGLYLENNLTTGAFTPERLELLNLLLAQIAISLTNAKLYQGVQSLNTALEDANRTLESRVKARTEELTQTLKVLRATQSELIIENELLRADTEPSTYDYQVGGSLGLDAPTYVVRQADRQLYKLIRNHHYCCVFNARQMGKSSLRVQMMKRMQLQNTSCVSIDLSIIGNRQTSREQWYAGFMYSLATGLNLTDKADVQGWWRDNLMLSPVQRLSEFVRQVVLPHSTQNIVVFIDEVDSVMGLDFEIDDFFIWLRSCFNQRADYPSYKRLTFVLLGVATPAQLIQNPQSTPFNIGQAIELNGFQSHEAHPLLQGFSHKVEQPQSVLAQVLSWTGGQPFLTQKICQLIQQEEDPISEGEAVDRVDQLVHAKILDNWEVKDDPEHLRTIRDRILSPARPSRAMLEIYQQLLASLDVLADESPAQVELILSGLVVRQGRQLAVANRLYSAVFDQRWVTHAVSQL